MTRIKPMRTPLRVVSTVDFSTSVVTRRDCALSTHARVPRRGSRATGDREGPRLAGSSFIGGKFARNLQVFRNTVANGTATAPKPPFSSKRSSGRPTQSDLSSPTTSIRYICFAMHAIDLFAELPSKFYETFAAHFTRRGMLLKFLLLVGGSVLACLISTTAGSMLRSRRWLGCHLSLGLAARDLLFFTNLFEFHAACSFE
ncbi:hypothetical protein MUK42_11871 [Musa troglodytarum]|uniref:Photosystem I reaction center subunit VI n=1 Tax=Musa troglodytarum TaxID=320322 RepID=A0A9E7FDC0_9LILI|nr:hypothetical protein MUK42_11871 [Musa troglodytarum]